MRKLGILFATFAAFSVLLTLAKPNSFAKLTREQVAFGEWAKLLYETQKTAEGMERFARNRWFFAEWPKRESLLVKKYHVEPWQFYEQIQLGLKEHWPTDRPEHRKAAEKALGRLH